MSSEENANNGLNVSLNLLCGLSEDCLDWVNVDWNKDNRYWIIYGTHRARRSPCFPFLVIFRLGFSKNPLASDTIINTCGRKWIWFPFCFFFGSSSHCQLKCDVWTGAMSGWFPPDGCGISIERKETFINMFPSFCTTPKPIRRNNLNMFVLLGVI